MVDSCFLYPLYSVPPPQSLDQLPDDEREPHASLRRTLRYNVSQVLDQALAASRGYGFATPFSVFSSLPQHPERALELDPWSNIGVVNLARLTDTPSLLSLALYHCTYLGRDLFDGWTREDGTVEHLSEADVRVCGIEARAALVHAHTVFLFSVFDTTELFSFHCEAFLPVSLHGGVTVFVVKLDL